MKNRQIKKSLRGSTCKVCGAPVHAKRPCEACGSHDRGDRSQVHARKARRKRYHKRGSRG